MAVVSLAKDYSEHHYYEMSAKMKIAGSGQLICGFFYYLIIILLRLPTLILMCVVLNYWFPVFVATAMTVNGILAFLTLRPSFSKTLWTSFASIISPTCYVSKYKVHTLQHPGDAFHRFYLWNSIGFFGLSMSSCLLVNILVYTIEDITQSLIGPKVPYLNPSQCWTEGDCTNIHLASSVVVFSAFLQILVTWSQNITCPVMKGHENMELEYFV